MALARINGALITDWASFHAQCQEALGFPEFYAGTMDAWVDCLSYLRDEDGMTQFHLKANETLEVIILDSDLMRQQVPDILDELSFCVIGINERYEDYGEKPALALVLL